MKSWKTTTAALVGCCAGFVALYPQHFPPVMVDLAKFVMIGGFGAIGILGKDADVHSTAREVEAATMTDDMAKAAGAK